MPGIVGTVAGAGVASAHLAKAGPDVAAAAAAVVLVTGVVLLIWGAVTLVRAVPGWWRLLAMPAAMALLWFVLFPLTVAVYATNLPPGPLGSATPATLWAQPTRMWPSAPPMGCGCRAGTSRPATAPRWWCCPAPGPPAPRCSARPRCWPGTATGRCCSTPAATAAPAGMRWTSAGGVTRTSPRRCRSWPASPPSTPARSPWWASPWAGSRPSPPSGADPRIRAVVAEGATGQQLADRGWLPHGITGSWQRGMEWVQYTTAGLISGAPRPTSIPEAIRAAAPRPVLIIAGGAVADEPIAARWFLAASPATVHVWVVPHAGHTRPGHRAPGVGNPRDQLPARGTGLSAMTAGQSAANTG